MPGINVSALSGGDLRRLLKVAHARHDGLLADRLEWEIAARATSGGRHAGPFATLPDDDQDEPDDHMTVSDPEPYAPEVTAREPAGATRSVLLVTLGAVAGSLLSASVFWGLGRMDGLPVLGRAQPQPTRAVVPAAPPAEQTLAVLAPEVLPPQMDAVAPAATVEAAPMETAPVEAPHPAQAAPVEVARKAEPVAPAAAPLPTAAAVVEVAQKPEPPAKAQKKPAAAAKAPSRKKPAETQLAERASRPPTLAEWLAKSEPEDPIH